MKRYYLPLSSSLALAAAFVVALGAAPQAQKPAPPTPPIPQSGVSQIFTLEGRFVRVAYNNEGYVSLGYHVAQESVGQDWMLLEIGLTLREGQAPFQLERNGLSISTPDGKTVPLPTNTDFLQTDARPLDMLASRMTESINYFPPSANQACRIGFFAANGSGVRAYDFVELNSSRACVGRLYFHVPGGIKYGQHWLNVKFKNSVVRAPFKIVTKEEEKVLDKNFKDLRKQVEDAFKKTIK